MKRKQLTGGKCSVLSAMAMIFGMLSLAVVMAVSAGATPIHPTAEQLLRQAEQPVMPYVPAQVGWQEPAAEHQDTAEEPGLSTARLNTSEILRDAEAARARRALLLHVARPDPRVLLAFGAIIFLLRKMRTLRESAAVPAPAQATSH